MVFYSLLQILIFSSTCKYRTWEGSGRHCASFGENVSRVISSNVLISVPPNYTPPRCSPCPAGLHHSTPRQTSCFPLIWFYLQFSQIPSGSAVTIVLVRTSVGNVSPFHKRSFIVVGDSMEEDLVPPIKEDNFRLSSFFYAGAARALREGCKGRTTRFCSQRVPF